MIKSLGAKIYAALVHNRRNQKMDYIIPEETQKKVFKKLILDRDLKPVLAEEHQFSKYPYTFKRLSKSL